MSDEKSLGSIIQSQVKDNFQRYSMFIILVIIWVMFTITTHGVFLSPRNISNLFSQTTYTGILAIGLVLVIVAGHIDLSAGAVVGLSGAIAAIVQVKYGLPTPVAVCAGILTGTLIGCWQGFWIAKMEIPAFIVTLSGMIVFRGILIFLTQGQTVGPLSVDFRMIGQGYIPSLVTIPLNPPIGMIKRINVSTIIIAILFICAFAYGELASRKKKVSYGLSVQPMNFYVFKISVISVVILFFFSFLIFEKGMQYSVLILAVFALAYSFMSQNTRFGRYVYAIGGNKEAARLSGINIVKINFMIMMSMGFLEGVSGIVFTGLMDSAAASGGTLFELDGISAAIIGGTSTLGGSGTIMGALVGALLMSSLNNGMQLMNLGADIQMILRGLILIFAVYLDFKAKKK